MPRTACALIGAMTPGLAALLGALAIALIGGTAWRATNGRMRSPGGSRTRRAGAGVSVPLSSRVLQGAGIQADAAAPPRAESLASSPGAAAAADLDVMMPASPADALPAPVALDPGVLLTSGQLGHALGERATLVQFSSAFCAPCRATRRILADVAGMTEGVAHVEIDAESRLDLVRELNVLRTPTVLVLAGDGRIVRRASGQPRKPDVIAAIGVATGP
jgi:thiol-disulfide isomerase/thioredoxin